MTKAKRVPFPLHAIHCGFPHPGIEIQDASGEYRVPRENCKIPTGNQPCNLQSVDALGEPVHFFPRRFHGVHPETPIPAHGIAVAYCPRSDSSKTPGKRCVVAPPGCAHCGECSYGNVPLLHEKSPRTRESPSRPDAAKTQTHPRRHRIPQPVFPVLEPGQSQNQIGLISHSLQSRNKRTAREFGGRVHAGSLPLAADEAPPVSIGAPAFTFSS